MLLWVSFSSLVSLGYCCGNEPPSTGIWSVMTCDTLSRAADILSIPQNQIEGLNSELAPWFISPGDTYRVPYRPTVLAPATWFTTQNCTPILRLGYTGCGQARTAATTTSTTLAIPDSNTAAPTTHSSANISSTPSVSSAALSLPTSSKPVNAPLCYSGGKHANELQPVMTFLSNYACRAMMNANSVIGKEADSLSFLMLNMGGGILRHLYTVRWTPDCKVPQSVAADCSQIMYKNWDFCKKSRGGIFRHGCLDYAYEALNDKHIISCNGPANPKDGPDLSCTIS